VQAGVGTDESTDFWVVDATSHVDELRCAVMFVARVSAENARAP
jgi:hypothetical protein